MRVLIWGFGDYYKQKEQNLSGNNIVGFVSSKESGKYNGIEIINPESIIKYQFDKLYIMTGVKSVFEILDELKRIGYVDWNKIVFGWNVEPYIEDENILSEYGRTYCNSDGSCVYDSEEQIIELNSDIELCSLKKKIVRRINKNSISDIPSTPISRSFGFDRGVPVDRYYIEKFLKENASYIKGNVLEVAEREYTLKYGVDVKKSYTMHIYNAEGEDNIVANLETGEGVAEGMIDCFILTQTLPFIFDVKKAAENVVKFLRKGGTALVTVSGITQISRYDMERWGHYWSFTTASMKKLFEGCRDVESVDIKAYGNVKSAASGLYGLSVEDLTQKDLEYQDEDYQQIITAVVKKCGDILL